MLPAGLTLTAGVALLMVALLPGVTLLKVVTDNRYLSVKLVRLMEDTLTVVVPAFALVHTIVEVLVGLSPFTVPGNEIVPPEVAVVPLYVLPFTAVTVADDRVIFETGPDAVAVTLPDCALLVISQVIVLVISLAVSM